MIRQQRHLATRVIIATQEPTLSPKLLELCTVTIVHRFTSPSWFKALQGHIAGLSDEFAVDEKNESREHGEVDEKQSISKILRDIVELQTGEGLLFCPTAWLDGEKDLKSNSYRPRKLGIGHMRIRTRGRISADGGQSIMAE